MRSLSKQRASRRRLSQAVRYGQIHRRPGGTVGRAARRPATPVAPRCGRGGPGNPPRSVGLRCGPGRRDHPRGAGRHRRPRAAGRPRAPGLQHFGMTAHRTSSDRSATSSSLAVNASPVVTAGATRCSWPAGVLAYLLPAACRPDEARIPSTDVVPPARSGEAGQGLADAHLPRGALRGSRESPSSGPSRSRMAKADRAALDRNPAAGLAAMRSA